jgi:hypothetical protein
MVEVDAHRRNGNALRSGVSELILHLGPELFRHHQSK